MPIETEPKGPKPFSPGTLMIRSNWKVSKAPFSFAIHVAKAIADAWSGADITHVLTELASAIVSDLLPALGPATTNVNNQGTDLTSNMGLQITDSGAGAGTDVSLVRPLPANVALRVSTPTILRVRGGHPGAFFAGLDYTNTDGTSCQMWTDATEAAFTSAFQSIYTALTGLALPSGDVANPVEVSYFFKGAFREPPLTVPINSGFVICQQRVCTRRRRLGKGVAGE